MRQYNNIGELHATEDLCSLLMISRLRSGAGNARTSFLGKTLQWWDLGLAAFLLSQQTCHGDNGNELADCICCSFFGSIEAASGIRSQPRAAFRKHMISSR